MRSALFSLVAALPAIIALPTPETDAAFLDKREAAKELIPNQWIVTFKDGLLSQSIDTVVSAVGINTTHRYDFGGFKGFAFGGDQSVVDTLLNLFPGVEVEQDQVAHASIVLQNPAPWGLGRISHRNKGSPEYIYSENPGAGTYAYIIDTGIFPHNDFGGRTYQAPSFVDGEGNDDCNSHGTHVAGTIGSNTYGVAKKTFLVGVKALGCNGSGTYSGIISAIQWTDNDINVNGRREKSVINMSLGGGYSQTLNDAVQTVINHGTFFALAAGNDNDNVANHSPASVEDACTVGATDKNDVRASFSNFGTDNRFDLFAPGVDIQSTINKQGQTAFYSGTSMASPHVAGLALYRIGKGGYAAPVNLCYFLRVDSTKDKIQDTRGSYNFLGYNNEGY